MRHISNSQLCPRTGLHPTLNAFEAFFLPRQAAPIEIKPKRVQVLTLAQFERRKEKIRAWTDKNRDDINAKKRASRAAIRELQAIPSRDVLSHERKPVMSIGSSRHASI